MALRVPKAETTELGGGMVDRPGPAALVALTAFANLGTRSNTAQGFSAACETPPAARPETSGVASTA